MTGCFGVLPVWLMLLVICLLLCCLVFSVFGALLVAFVGFCLVWLIVFCWFIVFACVGLSYCCVIVLIVCGSVCLVVLILVFW